jgi:hypothetical protein
MQYKKLAIGETISMILGLIGVGIQLLWPEKRWIGWIFIGLALVIAVGVALWALAQRLALQNHPSSFPDSRPVEQTVKNVGNPKIEVNPSFTQSQSQEVRVERVEPERNVALVITHRQDFMPIVIPSGEEAIMLPLRPEHTEALITQGNGTPEAISWPRDRSLLPPIEWCVRCQLINHGNTTLLNLLMRFEVKFYEGNSSAVPPVSEHLHAVGIRVLKPNIPFTFYIVNQSPYLTVAHLPRDAYVEVVGEAGGRVVPFVQPTGSIDHLFESMPAAILPGSKIDWTK